MWRRGKRFINATVKVQYSEKEESEKLNYLQRSTCTITTKNTHQGFLDRSKAKRTAVVTRMVTRKIRNRSAEDSWMTYKKSFPLSGAPRQRTWHEGSQKYKEKEKDSVINATAVEVKYKEQEENANQVVYNGQLVQFQLKTREKLPRPVTRLATGRAGCCQCTGWMLSVHWQPNVSLYIPSLIFWFRNKL